MREARKGKSKSGDSRIPVLLFLVLFLLIWHGLAILHQDRESPVLIPTERTLFRFSQGSLEMLASPGDADRLHNAEPADLPQHVRPVLFLPISINEADCQLLQTIPGIGPSLGRSIVDFRENRGRINTYPELLEIKGIGPAKLETIRKHTSL